MLKPSRLQYKDLRDDAIVVGRTGATKFELKFSTQGNPHPVKSSRNVGIRGRNSFKLITLGRNQLAASDDGETTWIAIPQLSDSSLSIRTTTPMKVECNGLSG